MAEPSAGLVVMATGALGVTAASLFPGVDLNAVVGAFGGALFFIVFKQNISALARVGYLIASWVFGYYLAVELLGRKWTETSGLAAFLGGLLCTVICVSLLEWGQGGRTPGWLRYLLDYVGGRRNG